MKTWLKPQENNFINKCIVVTVGVVAVFAAETLCGVCLSMGGLALLCVLSYCSRHRHETCMLISFVECVLVCYVCAFNKGSSRSCAV